MYEMGEAIFFHPLSVDNRPQILYNKSYKLLRIMSEPLYTIEEMQTDGWKEPDQYCTNLTKEKAQEKLQWLINTEGLNPNRLRIQRQS